VELYLHSPVRLYDVMLPYFTRHFPYPELNHSIGMSPLSEIVIYLSD